jgi:hypothetical protein
MINIDYQINDAGWATGKIGNEDTSETFGISYLHDSLKELAESAIEIQNKDCKSVIFMEEPGEHQLVLTKKDRNLIEYELRWYREWASWNETSVDNFELILKGETTIPKYINQVRTVLIKIMNDIGPELYKEKWGEHDFPITEYEKLK